MTRTPKITTSRGARRLGALLASVVLVAFVLRSPAAQASEPRTPITVRLELPNELPGLNVPFVVRAVVASAVEAPDTTVEFNATDGIRIAGPRTTRLNLSAGGETSLETTAVIESAGDQTLGVRARRVVVPGSEIWGDLATAHFHTTAFGTRPGFGPIRDGGVSAVMPPSRPVTTREVPPSLGLRVDPAALQNPPTHVPPEPNGTIDPDQSYPGLAGTITATSQLYGRDPNDNVIAIGEMLGEIVNATTGASIVYFFTDSEGLGTISFTNPGAQGFYVRWWAYMNWNYAPYDNLTCVQPNASAGWGDSHKLWTSGFFGVGDGSINLGTYYVNPGESRRGAFSLLNDCNNAWLFVLWNGGSTPGGVQVKWQADSSDGTYYIPGGEVHLRGEDWGTAANPPPSDTMIHEYGHKIMQTAYDGWFPITDCPSPHYIQLQSGSVCAWTEGWADFLPLATNGDAFFTWPSGARVDLEAETWGDGWDSGDRVEGRVAGALYDIMDYVNEGYDVASAGFYGIWNTFEHAPTTTFSNWFGTWSYYGGDDCTARASLFQSTIIYDPVPNFLMPNLTYDEDSVNMGLVDLWAYASDGTCPVSSLRFSVDGADPRYGLSITDNRYLNAVPAPDFNGEGWIYVACIDLTDGSAIQFVYVTVNAVDDAPAAPGAPAGPKYGESASPMSFTSTPVDPDGEDVQALFYFGDGTYSDWSSFVASGTTVTVEHVFDSAGDFGVQAYWSTASGESADWSEPIVVNVAGAGDVLYRVGTVGADGGDAPVDVLAVNDTPGEGLRRIVEVSVSQAIDVELAPAPAGPETPRYAVWGWLAAPSEATYGTLPVGLGTMAMNPFLRRCGVCPTFAASNFGYGCAKLLCPTPEGTGSASPGIVMHIDAGQLAVGDVLFLQGVIADATDTTRKGSSITNGIEVRIVE